MTDKSLAKLIHDAAVESDLFGDEYLESTFSCQACGGRLEELGRLGPLLWFRCRDCGMDQSVEVF